MGCDQQWIEPVIDVGVSRRRCHPLVVRGLLFRQMERQHNEGKGQWLAETVPRSEIRATNVSKGIDTEVRPDSENLTLVARSAVKPAEKGQPHDQRGLRHTVRVIPEVRHLTHISSIAVTLQTTNKDGKVVAGYTYSHEHVNQRNSPAR